MKANFIIEGLDCANCAYKIEKKVQKITGVKSASIIFFTGKLVVELDKDVNDEILFQIEKAIKKEEPDVKIRRI